VGQQERIFEIHIARIQLWFSFKYVKTGGSEPVPFCDAFGYLDLCPALGAWTRDLQDLSRKILWRWSATRF
jgi:hypothetical protein